MQRFNTASSDNIRDTINLVMYELSLFFYNRRKSNEEIFPSGLKRCLIQE